MRIIAASLEVACSFVAYCKICIRTPWAQLRIRSISGSCGSGRDVPDLHEALACALKRLPRRQGETNSALQGPLYAVGDLVQFASTSCHLARGVNNQLTQIFFDVLSRLHLSLPSRRFSSWYAAHSILSHLTHRRQVRCLITMHMLQ